jgi:aminoglycoside phosphotransferase (APT) family kinase protein
MSVPLDTPRAVRPGEELDIAKLEPFLRSHIPGANGPLAIEQFPSGYSNLTYLLHLGTQELVLRRPPFGNQVKSAHDMGREYRVLSRLCNVYPLAPRPYVYCEDDSVLGAPFYVMERRRGIVIRRQLPHGLALDPATLRRLCESLIDGLAELHGLDYQAAGLGDLGKPEGYLERQVAGWIRRYHNAQTDKVPAMDQMAHWLTEKLPAKTGAALIHNDYKFDNLLLDPNDLSRVIAVFDWEMATLGDPLSDLGTSIAYWVQPDDPPGFQSFAFGPTNLPGALTRRELIERYAAKTGRDVSNILYYYCFGLYKVAVIVQQIYVRYVKGFTKDERFAQLNEQVAEMARAAVHAADTGDYGA